MSHRSHMNHLPRTAVLLSLGLRAFLYFTIDLTSCPELVTPLSSMHRVREGLSLQASGHSPYDGDMYHQPPLTLSILNVFFHPQGSQPRWQGVPLHLLFFVGDVLVAWMIRSIVANKINRDQVLQSVSVANAAATAAATAATNGTGLGVSSCLEARKILSSVSSLEPVPNKYYVPSFLRDSTTIPNLCAAAYLLHPFALGSSAAWDLSSLVRVTTVGSLYFVSTGRYSWWANACLAVSAYSEIHPVMFIVATTAMEVECKQSATSRKGNNQVSYIRTLLKNMGYFTFWFGILQLCSYYVVTHFFATATTTAAAATIAAAATATTTTTTTTTDFWSNYYQSIHSTYIWHLSALDHTPNVGIYWYFFAMLFNRFRSYFTFAFNVQLFVYVAPLVVRIRGRPYILFTILSFLIGLLRPYPTLGDVALPMVLLLMHPYVVARMRNKVLLVTTSFVGASLLPGMGRLWLYPGSFCANHYYFTQLTYCLSTLVLVSEFLNAALLRDREIDEKVANAKKAAKQTGNEDENVEKNGGEDVDENEKKKEQ